jgi:hypothetical protein
MEGVMWTDGPEHWPTGDDADLSLSPRDLLQPFPHTAGCDLSHATSAVERTLPYLAG